MRSPQKAAPLILAAFHQPGTWRARAGAQYIATILNSLISFEGG